MSLRIASTFARQPALRLVPLKPSMNPLMKSVSKVASFAHPRHLAIKSHNEKLKFPTKDQLFEHLQKHPFLKEPLLEDDHSLHETVANTFCNKETAPAEMRSLVVRTLAEACRARHYNLSDKQFNSLAINISVALDDYAKSVQSKATDPSYSPYQDLNELDVICFGCEELQNHERR